jgi:hypothetical protein
VDLLFAVLLVELVDTTFGVEVTGLTREERVRLAGNVDLDQGVFLTIFPFDVLFAVERRTGEELQITGDVLENDFTIVLWVNTWFHKQVASNGRPQGRQSQKLSILLRKFDP